MYQIINDQLFFIFLIATIILIAIKYDQYIRIFTSGIKKGRSTIQSDYLYIMAFTLLSFYPIYALISTIVGNNLLEFNLLGLYIYFTTATLAVGIIYTMIFAPMWYNTMTKDEKGGGMVLLGVFPSIMFGAFFATYISVGLNPNTAAITSVYGYYVDVARTMIERISLFAIIPILETLVTYTWDIFRHNFMVALRSTVFAAGAGVFGVGTLVAIIPLFTTTTVAGVFGGIMLRTNLQEFMAPIAAVIAVLGIPPFWHTFYEFVSFGLISASVGIIVYSLVTGRKKNLKLSASGLIIGIGILLFGAFNEVTVSAALSKIIGKFITFTPEVTEIAVGGGYFIASVFTALVVIGLMLIITYAIELILRVTEEVSV